MNKQIVIAAVLAGVLIAVFAPVILLDRDEEEASAPPAEQAQPAETAEAAATRDGDSLGLAEPQSADVADAAEAEAAGSTPASEAETADRAGASEETAPAPAGEAAASVPAETAQEEAAQAETAESGDAAPAPAGEAAEAGSGGEVAATISLADVPTVSESEAAGAEAGESQAAIEVAESPEPVPALEQGSAEDPSADAMAEAAEQGAASVDPDAASVAVVPRAAEAPQVAALPDEPDATDPPPARTPSFDVVRVEPTGEAVIAGRAEPGSRVVLTDDGEDIASVEADSGGDWVIILDRPLEGGSHQLGLRAETPGGESLESENVVIVAVPERPVLTPDQPTAVAEAQSETAPGTEAQAEAQTGTQAMAQAETQSQTETRTAAVQEPAGEALAVLAPRKGEGPSVVLQRPETEGIADRELVLNAIDYDAAGQVIVSGKAPPGSRVVVYLDDRAIGQVEADENGNWVLQPDVAVTVGLHRLRLDQLDAGGKVVARVESPFSRAQALLDLPGERFVVVQPGNSLWFIARETYGEGLRYTLIFDSNNGQIRDPDLIYPGQIFLLPELN